MHRRSLRHGLVVLLFLAAAGAAAFAWSVDRQLAALAATEHAASTRFDTLVQSIARFDAAQQVYDPAREAGTEWFARVRRLLAQIESGAKELHTSPASAAAARAFDDVTARVAAAVMKAEENLRSGYDLMAADLVQDEARPGADAMRAAALEWRAAEANAGEATRAALFERLWMVLGGTLAFWAIGVLLLAPRQTVAASAAPAGLPILVEPAGDTPLAAAVDATPMPVAVAQASEPPAMDLVPAAELCADIARADDGLAFEALVDRAAGVIGASGIVVWLDGGDDALVPVVAHGYGPHARAILGTLPLADENMTTRAWHTGQLQWIDSDGASRSAIAAPMFQGSRRTGVLSVELQEGAKAAAAARALTSILSSFRSRVATIVSMPPSSARRTSSSTSDTASTALLLMLVMMSPARSPARPAGESASTVVTITPPFTPNVVAS
jgi:hypothetical protein